MIGKKFGRLTVLSMSNTVPGKGKFWLCKCDCGTECVRRTGALNDKAHKEKSCGCARRDSIKKASAAAWKVTTKFSHPHKIKLKWLYNNMVNRCHKPGTNRYERYGGRGIVVCDEWRTNPTAFYEWAVANGYSPELWIERNDYNGNYCPENCCFKTPKEQANNTSRNHFLSLNGRTQTVAQWAEEFGVMSQRLHKRLARGWSDERTLSEPFTFKQ